MLLPALGAGLLGGAHCMGMCGGISAALSFAVPTSDRLRRVVIIVAYHIGRILSYALIGASVAYLSSMVSISDMPIARTSAGLLLIAMGFYLANWWKGLNQLEKLGAYAWRYLKPVATQLLPVCSVLSAFALGLIWGWLPCGLVYTALALAIAQPDAVAGATVMLAFGLGTLPAMLLASFGFNVMRQWLAKANIRSVFAVMYIVFGVWTVLVAWGFIPHAGHEHHHHPSTAKQCDVVPPQPTNE